MATPCTYFLLKGWRITSLGLLQERMLAIHTYTWFNDKFNFDCESWYRLVQFYASKTLKNKAQSFVLSLIKNLHPSNIRTTRAGVVEQLSCFEITAFFKHCLGEGKRLFLENKGCKKTLILSLILYDSFQSQEF